MYSRFQVQLQEDDSCNTSGLCSSGSDKSTPLSDRTSTIVTLFCRRRSRTSCSMFKMLQHIWSQGPGNTSVVCQRWCMTPCTGWLFLSKCSTSLLWVHRCLRHRAPWYLANYCVQSPKVLVASICDLPDVIDCQFCKFVTAFLGPVHFLSPGQQSGIHCLIICAIQLLTSNNLGGSWRRICLLDIWHFSALEVLHHRILQINISLLTYLSTFCKLNRSNSKTFSNAMTQYQNKLKSAGKPYHGPGSNIELEPYLMTDV